MKIVLNGQPQEAPLEPAGATIAALIESLGMKPDRIAVERNGEIVPRADWVATSLAEGDRLEVVHFVGGGRR